MDEKATLRKKAKQIRSLLQMNKISQAIINSVIEADFYKDAENVMIFYPLENEINLTGLMKGSKKKFYLPKMDGDKILVCPYRYGDKLVKSKYNVMEPITPSVKPDILDIVFVPALMVDNNCNRLGYGGGYYDRFLKTLPETTIRLTPIASVLKVDKLPTTEFDEQVHAIIDEQP